MTAPLQPFRTDRSVAGRVAPTAPRGASASDDDPIPDQQAQLAAQHAAFDYQAAETAEMLREHQALEALMQENLKNEDEIMKKWIALI